MLDLFGRQKHCLRIMGHYAVREKSLVLNERRNVVFFGIVLLVLSANWPMINYSIYNIDNLILATSSLSICFTNILTVIKMTTFLIYKCRFVALMAKLEAMYDDIKYTAAEKTLQGSNRKAILMVKFYFISSCITGSYFMLDTILMYLWSKINMEQLKLELPMPMRFPFDYESILIYGLVYIYTGIITLTVVMYAVAVDGLFISFATNLVAHLKILQQSIMENTFLKSEKELQCDIKSYIKYHDLILNLYKELCEIYSPIVFGQFLMTSLQVCVIVYQMVMHVDTFLVVVKNFAFFVSILLQLFMYCYGGEILTLESLKVGIAVQLSNWYNLKSSHRRMLLLLMLRSQREAIIRGGFYEASLANFMLILKAALSYITLIQSIEQM